MKTVNVTIKSGDGTERREQWGVQGAQFTPPAAFTPKGDETYIVEFPPFDGHSYVPGDIVGVHEVTDAQAIDWQLEAMAKQIRSWLDWHAKHRAEESLVTVGDTHIMALPVPFWPNHSQFENWIKTLESARTALANGQGGDGK